MGKRASILDQKESFFAPSAEEKHAVEGFIGSNAEQAYSLPVERIQPDPSQPRKAFDEEAIASLAASIQEKGLLQPITVRKAEDGFIIVAGERRWRAHQHAQMTKIRAFISNVADANEAFEIALIENLQREDLTPFEEAAGIAELMKRKHYKQKQAAQVVGRSTSQVSRLLKLNGLPTVVKEKVVTSQLSQDQLFRIAEQDTPEAMLKLYSKIVQTGLNVRETRQAAKGEETTPTHPLVLKISRFEQFLARTDPVELDQLEGAERQELSSLLDRLAERVKEIQQHLWNKRESKKL